MLDVVAEHRRTEERGGVRRRRGGEADLDGVEMIDRVAPKARLLECVAAVTFIGDDEVEGVDFRAHIEMPDDLAIGRVKERDAQTIPVARTDTCACGVPFGLFENFYSGSTTGPRPRTVDRFGLAKSKSGASDGHDLIGEQKWRRASVRVNEMLE